MTRPVISAWSAVSPFGIGRDSFVDGLARGEPPATLPDPAEGPVPGGRPHLLVPGFDIREVLGRKGTRSMDRVSALAVTAVRELLDSAERNREVGTGDHTALVLGTTTGSVKSMMDITRDTLIHKKPFYIDAARIPNAIMNSASAQCAIWHQLTGPNTTVAGGRVAGLFALRYSLRLLRADRAKAVLCGGAEEFSPARAWLEHHGRVPGEPGTALGEGCALLLVEPGDAGGDRLVLAEVLAVETGIHTGDNLDSALGECLQRALHRAGVTADQVWAVSSVPSDGPPGDAERSAVNSVFDGLSPRRIPDGQPWGDAGAVTATFQIITVLAAAQEPTEAAGRLAMIVSVDRDGALGCALLARC